ncbi:hypothetical protein Huta_2037 [Halorhabdus utahensis DSM 12940]|uniref:Uncharacterized protein n=1 Tax=Halorhabdus utahensis (strain DSM 12940 / JCM 11049 / AX-2) TaxID=519442 RepID=C7NTL5_HALUD|nr:hypothetical protein Huta_2037 [Halorhabdus utahensis DSM 12940]
MAPISDGRNRDVLGDERADFLPVRDSIIVGVRVIRIGLDRLITPVSVSDRDPLFFECVGESVAVGILWTDFRRNSGENVREVRRVVVEFF